MSEVRFNAEKDPDYAPYCLGCRTMARMKIIERFFWRCGECQAEHDERRPVPEAAPCGLSEEVEAALKNARGGCETHAVSNHAYCRICAYYVLAAEILRLAGERR